MNEFVSAIINMSLVGTYCILVVLLLRLFLRKAPRVLTYLLWGVVFLRLAVPIFPEAPVSLVPEAVRTNPVSSYFSGSENVGLMDQFNGNSPVDEDVKIPSDSATGPITGPKAAIPSPITTSNWMEIVTTSLTSKITMNQTVSLVWCGGVVLLASYNLISYILLRRRLVDAIPEDGIFYTDKISSPFVLGLLRPRIYLPTGLSPEEKSFIILHEKAHLRRQDPTIKLIAFMITCLHWFNPFAWIAFLLFSRDIETSCDESVIHNLDTTARKEYSTTLLSVASGRNLLRPMPLAFGDGDLKGRIKNVLNYRKPAIWIIGLAVVAIAVISIGLLMNPIGTKLLSTRIDDSNGAISTDSPVETTESAATETSDTSEIASSATESTVVVTDATTSEPTFILPEKSNAGWTEDLYNWTAKTPADPSTFESIFTKYNYTTTKLDSEGQADTVYQATSPDGKSIITCTVYTNTEISYRMFDAYLVDIFNGYPLDSNGLGPLYEEYSNYYAALDLPYVDSDTIFRAAFLSGNVVLDISIPLEMSEILPYMHAAQEFGFGKSWLNIDGPIPEMPDVLTLCTPEEMTEILAEEGLTVKKSEYNEEQYSAISEDSYVDVGLYPQWTPHELEYGYLTNLYGGLQDTIAYKETTSYRSVISSSVSPGSYIIYVYQDGWELVISVDWWADPNTEASQRALAEDLLKKLCFPDA